MRPRHRPQVQIAKYVGVEVIGIGIKMTACAWDITAEKVHVILVDTAAMVGDAAWNIRGVAGSLNLPPAIVALDRVTTG